ncbi:MAG: DUF1269 domain-containing protein [Planctomycetota bacterium]|jgi:uncharacterized membrane protein
MSEFIAITYDGKFKAQEVRMELLKMQKEHLIDLEDAVVAVKNPDGKVKLHQMYNLTASGAIGGGFWGALIGLIFLNPLLGALIGGAIGTATGALSDIGINNEFMKELGANMHPNSSTLFVLIRKITPDKVLEEIRPFGGKLLRTSLSHEDEAKLQAALDAAKEKVGV